MTLRMPGARLLAWAAAALVALATGCQSVQTTSAGAVGVDRRQAMSALVSEADLRKGSEQAYAQLMGQARQKGALNADAQLTQRVRTIAQRMIPVTGAFRPDAPGWKWEVNVVQSDQLNAWCMPGG